MTTPNKHYHHPRPQGQDLLKKEFKVEDAAGTVFGTDLTYDEAWKLKEQVAGSRKSTTPRVLKVANGTNGHNGSVNGHVVPTWTDAERKAALARAAAVATRAAAIDAAKTAAETPNVTADNVELSASEQALIDEILGGESDSDDEVDDAIAEAEAAAKSIQ